MTNEQGKRGFKLVTIFSLIVGAVVGFLTYGSLIDVRALNIVGLIYILVLGCYALFIAVRAATQKDETA